MKRKKVMKTYEIKTDDTEVTIYRISEEGQAKIKEKVAKIDLTTGELFPIGRTKIAGAETPETDSTESKFPTRTVILILIFLVAAIGFFAFFQATQQEKDVGLFFLLGFVSLTAVVISIIFYIKWLIGTEEPDSLDSLQPQDSFESAENHVEDDENVQTTIVTSEKDSYFLLLGGEVKGPFTYDQLKKSEFPSNVQVTTETLNDWFPASKFELLRGLALEPKDPSAPISKNDYQITNEGLVKCTNKQ